MIINDTDNNKVIIASDYHNVFLTIEFWDDIVYFYFSNDAAEQYYPDNINILKKSVYEKRALIDVDITEGQREFLKEILLTYIKEHEDSHPTKKCIDDRRKSYLYWEKSPLGEEESIWFLCLFAASDISPEAAEFLAVDLFDVSYTYEELKFFIENIW